MTVVYKKPLVMRITNNSILNCLLQIFKRKPMLFLIQFATLHLSLQYHVCCAQNNRQKVAICSDNILKLHKTEFTYYSIIRLVTAGKMTSE